MKSIFKLAVLFSFTIFFSSCATHYGLMSSSSSLSSNNFKVIKLAKGESSTTKIFGIGGLDKDALVADAKKNLLENNPLKDGQVLANITVDFKNSFMLIIMETKVTITADIIEFK